MFSQFDPYQTSVAKLDATQPVLLSVLTQDASMDTLKWGVKALNQCVDYFTWLIYVEQQCPLELELITSCLESASEQLNILLLPEADTPYHLPELFAAAHACFDLAPYAQIPIVFKQSIAMNVPIICHPENQLNVLPIEGYVLMDPDSDDSLLDKFTQIQHSQTLRSRLMYRMLEAGLEKDYFNQELNWLEENSERIELATIFFWGRSGSVLLNSLLDSHPQIITMGRGDFAAISVFSQIWTYLEQFQFSNMAQMIDEFCRSRRAENLPDNKQHLSLFSEAEPEYEKAFKFYFHHVIQSLATSFGLAALKEKTRKVFFIGLHYAYYLANGFTIQGRHLIVFQQHWTEDLPQLAQICQDFPGFKMLGMIRQPMRGYYSMLAHVLEQNQDKQWDWEDLVLTARYLHTWRHILMGWNLAETLIGKSVYGISLEMLHQKPQETMLALTKYLNISWHDSLLQSTLDAQDMSIASGVHGVINQDKPVFDPQRVNYSQWKQQFSELDNFVLEGILHEAMSKYLDVAISPFQKALSCFLLFFPLKLERKAFQKAIRQRSEEQIKLVLLNYTERCYYALLFVCGFRFTVSLPQYRKTSESLLGIKKSV